jgi:hypothetical protein
MISPLGLAAGGALNVGANLATDNLGNGDDEDRYYAKLCQISQRLGSLMQYSDRERQRTAYIAELVANFAAGVLDTTTYVPFNPPSSLSVDHFVFSVDTACELVLQMGTRGPSILLNPASSPARVDLPYHMNGGAVLNLSVIGATTVKVRGFVVCYLENNRLGPVKDLGDYGD